eukprot:SM000218S06595  [mRNA]  locus=s218:69990:77115:- [translate_table: standard]
MAMVRMLGIGATDEEPREITSSPVAATGPGDGGWLLRFFDSAFFCEWIAVSYLHKHGHGGVRDYLCNRMYALPLQAGMDRYLFQLTYLAVHQPSLSLEKYIADMCAKSLPISLKVTASPRRSSPLAMAVVAPVRFSGSGMASTVGCSTEVYWFLLAEAEDTDDAEIRQLQERCQAAALDGSWPPLVGPQHPADSSGRNRVFRLLSSRRIMPMASAPAASLATVEAAALAEDGGAKESSTVMDLESSLRLLKKLMPGPKMKEMREALTRKLVRERGGGASDKVVVLDDLDEDLDADAVEEPGKDRAVSAGGKAREDEERRFFRRLSLLGRSKSAGSEEDETSFFRKLFKERSVLDPKDLDEDDLVEDSFFRRLFRGRGEDDEGRSEKSQERAAQEASEAAQPPEACTPPRPAAPALVDENIATIVCEEEGSRPVAGAGDVAEASANNDGEKPTVMVREAEEVRVQRLTPKEEAQLATGSSGGHFMPKLFRTRSWMDKDKAAASAASKTEAEKPEDKTVAEDEEGGEDDEEVKVSTKTSSTSTPLSGGFLRRLFKDRGEEESDRGGKTPAGAASGTDGKDGTPTPEPASLEKAAGASRSRRQKSMDESSSTGFLRRLFKERPETDAEHGMPPPPSPMEVHLGAGEPVLPRVRQGLYVPVVDAPELRLDSSLSASTSGRGAARVDAPVTPPTKGLLGRNGSQGEGRLAGALASLTASRLTSKTGQKVESPAPLSAPFQGSLKQEAAAEGQVLRGLPSAEDENALVVRDGDSEPSIADGLTACGRSSSYAKVVPWEGDFLSEADTTGAAKEVQQSPPAQLAEPLRKAERLSAKPPLPKYPSFHIRKGTFHATLDFYKALCDISSGLVDVFPLSDRQKALKESLAELNAHLVATAPDGGVCHPFEDGLWRVMHMPEDEAMLLNSRDKVPFMIFIEVLHCTGSSKEEARRRANAAGIPLAADSRPPPWAFSSWSLNGGKPTAESVKRAMVNLWDAKGKVVDVGLAVKKIRVRRTTAVVDSSALEQKDAASGTENEAGSAPGKAAQKPSQQQAISRREQSTGVLETGAPEAGQEREDAEEACCSGNCSLAMRQCCFPSMTVAEVKALKDGSSAQKGLLSGQDAEEARDDAANHRMGQSAVLLDGDKAVKPAELLNAVSSLASEDYASQDGHGSPELPDGLAPTAATVASTTEEETQQDWIRKVVAQVESRDGAADEGDAEEVLDSAKDSSGRREHRRIPSGVAMAEVRAAAANGQAPPGLPVTTSVQPESCSEGMRKSDTFVVGEGWAERKERIRKRSKYGALPDWDLRSVSIGHTESSDDSGHKAEIIMIVKSGDDCRQEHLAVQLVSHFHDIYREAGLPLWIRPYEVLVTSSHTALIETIPDAISIHSLKSRHPELTSLRDHFCKKYTPGTSAFEAAQRNFVESMAGYSLLCYILQVKDRHNGNIMLDDDGHVIHIDFGFMLSNSPGGVNFESAPFKLTRELLEVMDSDADGSPSDAYDYFKDSGCPCFKAGPRTLQNLRKRFHLALTEEQCISLMLSLISSSQDAWRTRQYDYYQRVLNGIL